MPGFSHEIGALLSMSDDAVLADAAFTRRVKIAAFWMIAVRCDKYRDVGERKMAIAHLAKK